MTPFPKASGLPKWLMEREREAFELELYEVLKILKKKMKSFRNKILEYSFLIPKNSPIS